MSETTHPQPNGTLAGAAESEQSTPPGWRRECVCLAASRAMILLCSAGSEDARAPISHTGELLGGPPTMSRLFNHRTVTQEERRPAATDPPSATTILLRAETAAYTQRPRRAPGRRNAIATPGDPAEVRRRK
jgi:hypothetical protein